MILRNGPSDVELARTRVAVDQLDDEPVDDVRPGSLSGHNYIGHTYIGYEHIGHGYIRP